MLAMMGLGVAGGGLRCGGSGWLSMVVGGFGRFRW